MTLKQEIQNHQHFESLSIAWKQNCTTAGIAESMNNFFCAIGETPSSKIPQTKIPLLENVHKITLQNN